MEMIDESLASVNASKSVTVHELASDFITIANSELEAATIGADVLQAFSELANATETGLSYDEALILIEVFGNATDWFGDYHSWKDPGQWPNRSEVAQVASVMGRPLFLHMAVENYVTNHDVSVRLSFEPDESKLTIANFSGYLIRVLDGLNRSATVTPIGKGLHLTDNSAATSYIMDVDTIEERILGSLYSWQCILDVLIATVFKGYIDNTVLNDILEKYQQTPISRQIRSMLIPSDKYSLVLIIKVVAAVIKANLPNEVPGKNYYQPLDTPDYQSNMFVFVADGIGSFALVAMTIVFSALSSTLAVAGMIASTLLSLWNQKAVKTSGSVISYSTCPIYNYPLASEARNITFSSDDMFLQEYGTSFGYSDNTARGLSILSMQDSENSVTRQVVISAYPCFAKLGPSYSYQWSYTGAGGGLSDVSVSMGATDEILSWECSPGSDAWVLHDDARMRATVAGRILYELYRMASLDKIYVRDSYSIALRIPDNTGVNLSRISNEYSSGRINHNQAICCILATIAGDPSNSWGVINGTDILCPTWDQIIDLINIRAVQEVFNFLLAWIPVPCRLSHGGAAVTPAVTFASNSENAITGALLSAMVVTIGATIGMQTLRLKVQNKATANLQRKENNLKMAKANFVANPTEENMASLGRANRSYNRAWSLAGLCGVKRYNGVSVGQYSQGDSSGFISGVIPEGMVGSGGVPEDNEVLVAMHNDDLSPEVSIENVLLAIKPPKR